MTTRDEPHHPAPATPSLAGAISQVMVQAVAAGCSDLHLRAQEAPAGRHNGRLVKLNLPGFSSAEIGEIVRLSARKELPALGALEYSFDHGHGFRVRCHAYRDSEGWALAMRFIPAVVPTFADLRLPPVVKSLAVTRPGLVLVTGPMGNGKSTTAAAMLNHMCSLESVHAISLEDPIEYRLTSSISSINQREIGREVPDLRQGIREALREDADIIFIGEVREAPELELALHAADMGMTVVATVHTHGVAATFTRLIGMSAPDAQGNIRERLAESLRGVISQRLLPRRGGQGRVLATEIAVNTYAMKDLLRDPARLKTVSQVLERGGDAGMHTFDQSLLALCQVGLIEVEAALAIAGSPGNLKRTLNLAGAAVA